MLEHVKLVEDDLGLVQRHPDGIEIRPMHVHADGLHGPALSCVQAVVKQRAETVLAPILLQGDHFAANQIT